MGKKGLVRVNLTSPDILIWLMLIITDSLIDFCEYVKPFANFSKHCVFAIEVIQILCQRQKKLIGKMNMEFEIRGVLKKKCSLIFNFSHVSTGDLWKVKLLTYFIGFWSNGGSLDKIISQDACYRLSIITLRI